MNFAKCFYDTVAFDTVKVDVNTEIRKDWRPIKGSQDLKYKLRMYYCRQLINYRVMAYVELNGGPVVVDVTCFAGAVKKSSSFLFTTAGETVMSFDISPKQFQAAKGRIIFDLKFKDFKPAPCVNIGQLLKSLTLDELLITETDAKFVVGEKEIDFHRGILYNVSPVLKTCLEQGTPGIIEIENFDYETVKMVVDYCYQREIGDKTEKEVLDGLRFAKKYAIYPVAKVLETIIIGHIRESTFFDVAKYAWEAEHDEMKAACAKFYRRHLRLTLMKEFLELEESVQLGIIATAHVVESTI